MKKTAVPAVGNRNACGLFTNLLWESWQQQRQTLAEVHTVESVSIITKIKVKMWLHGGVLTKIDNLPRNVQNPALSNWLNQLNIIAVLENYFFPPFLCGFKMAWM